jgi:hypothetical protein
VFSVQQTSDDGFVLAGSSWSTTDGNKTASARGTPHYWVVRLGPDVPRLRAPFSWEGLSTNKWVLSGPPNSYVVEYGDDFSTWIPLQTNQVFNSAIPVLDAAEALTSPRRFYRARAIP